jgi:hypothetical protein
MSSIITDLVAGSARVLPEVLSPAEPHSARGANTPAAMHANTEPQSATSSSLTSFVPSGGLHPVAEEAHAKRCTSMFLRRVWRDGAG